MIKSKLDVDDLCHATDQMFRNQKVEFDGKISNLRHDFSELVKAVKSGNLEYFGQGKSDMVIGDELKSFINSLKLK